MTLFQRDRENIEIGREEGREEGLTEGGKLAAKILKLYLKDQSPSEIASSLRLDLQYVRNIITNYENE